MQLSKASGRAKGYMALAVTSILWGTTWVASKIGIGEIGALQMAAIRQLIAGACLVFYFMVFKKLPLPTAKEFRWLFIMGFLIFVLANGLSTWSLKYIPTGLSALIGALYPLSVVLIEMVFFKTKKMTLLTFAGFILGITGIGIVFYENAFKHSPSFIVGLILSLIAMLSWSLGTVFITRNKANLNPYYATGWQMVVSAFILFIAAQITQPVLAIQDISLKAWMVILYLVIFGSLISFVAFIYSMKKLPVAIASLFAYINPLVAMVLAAIIFIDEKLTLNILWGAIVTLIGVFLVNYSTRRSEKIITEAEI